MSVAEATTAPLLELGLVKSTQTLLGGIRASPAGHDGDWFERFVKWELGTRINEVWLVITKPPS